MVREPPCALQTGVTPKTRFFGVIERQIGHIGHLAAREMVQTVNCTRPSGLFPVGRPFAK
jgi:hypothetical protein